MEEVILPELLSDNLFDGPDDIFNYSKSYVDVSVRERKIVRPKRNYSDSETSGDNHMGERRQNAKFRTFYWKSGGDKFSVTQQKCQK
jgi:hypothetical protein